MTRTVREALAAATAELGDAGCDTPRLDAEVLLAEVLGVDRGWLIADGTRSLDADARDTFAALVRRRRAREPVAYILGRKEFRFVELAVDPRVFIPGPDTETVVEAALAALPLGSRVVDVGTGSGAIALALKHERPDLDVLATEASADALQVAEANARHLDLDVTFLHGDLLAPVQEPIDAVVSNPPYVEDDAELQPEITEYEPATALFAGPDGLDVYRRLVPQVAASMAMFVALEVGAGQSAAVGEMLRVAGFAAVEARRDLAGIERVVVAERAARGAAEPRAAAQPAAPGAPSC